MKKTLSCSLLVAVACALLTLAPGPLFAQKTTAPAADCPGSDPGGIVALRCRAWQLFAEMTGKRPVFNSPRWTPKRKVFPVPKSDNGGTGIDLFFSAAIPEEIYKQDPNVPLVLDGRTIPPQPLTYESVFFNRQSARHIRDRKLNTKDTSAKLLKDSRTEIPEFPRDAVVVKTFWRALPETGAVLVGLWGWNNLPQDPSRLFEIASSSNGFPNGFVCVEASPTPNSNCLEADKYFFMARVRRHPQDLICQNRFDNTCPQRSLPEGTKLILLGMHISSKEKPDWLWATFWWKGAIDLADHRVPRTHGTSWTCDDAQRPPAFSKGVWGNYSMDVTASLKRPKPQLDEHDPCGSPPNIGNHEELLAAFNPFSEELQPGGRKSSCINCHSKANTSDPRPLSIPNPCDAGQPLLETFEGHIRTDYSWSVAFALSPTKTSVADIPNPTPVPACSAPHAAMP